MTGELLVIAAAIGVTVALAKLYPERTESVFYKVVKVRRALFGLGLFFFAIVFARTGSPSLMFVSFLMFMYVALIALYEDPHEQAKETIDAFRNNG